LRQVGGTIEIAATMTPAPNSATIGPTCTAESTMDAIDNQALNDLDWRTLMRSIQLGKCILLLGPDAATDAADPAGLPLGQRLAQTLAGRLAPGAVADPTDLTAVAQAFVNTEGRGRIASRNTTL
jgi:hypothetical protein